MEKELSVVEYAKKHNLSRTTVYVMIGDGRIPKEKVVLIKRDPVIRIIEKEGGTVGK